MRKPTLALLLAAILPASLAGQARYSLAVGAMAGTKLLTDQIFEDIKVTQVLAPTVTLGANFPVSKRERAGFEVSFANWKSRVVETGEPTIEGPAYRTLSVTFGVDGPLFSRLTYHGGAGLLKYFPDKQGIFLTGGPLLLVLTGGVDYHFPLRAPFGLFARARYDYHRFSTDELQSAGFARTQDVHRVGLGLGIEYQRP